MKASTIASERRVPGPIAMQVEYSLVAREVEAEHFPAARDGGMGVMPWSPLAGGFLTGKYDRENTADTGRLSGANPFGDSKFTDRNWAILDTLREVAAECDCEPAQAALAWAMARPGVASTLVGARTVDQLKGNIAAASISLSDDQMSRLNNVSASTPGFTSSLASPMIRRMLYGGHEITAWGE